MSTSICWKLKLLVAYSEPLLSNPRGVKDSCPDNTTKTSSISNCSIDHLAHNKFSFYKYFSNTFFRIKLLKNKTSWYQSFSFSWHFSTFQGSLGPSQITRVNKAAWKAERDKGMQYILDPLHARNFKFLNFLLVYKWPLINLFMSVTPKTMKKLMTCPYLLARQNVWIYCF